MSLSEWMELTRPQTREEREITKLKEQLRQSSEQCGELRRELGKYKAMFERGWRADEDQWRLPREAALALLGES